MADSTILFAFCWTNWTSVLNDGWMAFVQQSIKCFMNYFLHVCLCGGRSLAAIINGSIYTRRTLHKYWFAHKYSSGFISTDTANFFSSDCQKQLWFVYFQGHSSWDLSSGWFRTSCMKIFKNHYYFEFKHNMSFTFSEQ